MIGEKGSDLIKASWPHSKEDEKVVVPPVDEKTELPLDESVPVNKSSLKNKQKQRKKFNKG